jgi:SpoVK/Ycf46/Vps4 family AAA+-type ATPase
MLDVPLITITVSDFLGAGQGGMENRAKLLFDVLERQTMSVVLFDELDQFLLDRNSKRFVDQETVFQFLTPGMLTKLYALRKKQSVVFLVATNYEERIDAAIKRAGRIDGMYLLLPPDKEGRMAILRGFDGLGAHLSSVGRQDLTRITRASAFLAYKDLQLVANQPWSTVDDFIERLDEAPRSVSFYSYINRFGESLSENRVSLFNGPRAELVGLIRLAYDAWDGGPGSWIDVAKRHPSGKAFAIAIMRDLIMKFDVQSKKALSEDLTKAGIQNDIVDM